MRSLLISCMVLWAGLASAEDFCRDFVPKDPWAHRSYFQEAKETRRPGSFNVRTFRRDGNGYVDLVYACAPGNEICFHSENQCQLKVAYDQFAPQVKKFVNTQETSALQVRQATADINNSNRFKVFICPLVLNEDKLGAWVAHFINVRTRNPEGTPSNWIQLAIQDSSRVTFREIYKSYLGNLVLAAEQSPMKAEILQVVEEFQSVGEFNELLGEIQSNKIRMQALLDQRKVTAQNEFEAFMKQVCH